MASSAIGIGCGMGIAMGQGISGLLGPRYGWRVPFLAVSVPAIACAVLVWICVPEVKRCGGEMRENRRNGVTIEQCRKCHGIFLDRGELEQLLGAESSFLGREVSLKAVPRRAAS